VSNETVLYRLNTTHFSAAIFVSKGFDSSAWAWVLNSPECVFLKYNVNKSSNLLAGVLGLKPIISCCGLMILESVFATEIESTREEEASDWGVGRGFWEEKEAVIIVGLLMAVVVGEEDASRGGCPIVPPPPPPFSLFSGDNNNALSLMCCCCLCCWGVIFFLSEEEEEEEEEEGEEDGRDRAGEESRPEEVEDKGDGRMRGSGI
jgi:hypothetical protein